MLARNWHCHSRWKHMSHTSYQDTVCQAIIVYQDTGFPIQECVFMLIVPPGSTCVLSRREYIRTLSVYIRTPVVLSGSVYQDTGCQSRWRAVSFSHRRAVQAATTETVPASREWQLHRQVVSNPTRVFTVLQPILLPCLALANDSNQCE